MRPARFLRARLNRLRRARTLRRLRRQGRDHHAFADPWNATSYRVVALHIAGVTPTSRDH